MIIPAAIETVKMQLWPKLRADSDAACFKPASWYRAMQSSYRCDCGGGSGIEGGEAGCAIIDSP
jgi:hypothetical protein